MLDDPLFWLLVLPGLLLGTYAQWRIKANVAKYSQIRTKDTELPAPRWRASCWTLRGLQDVKIEATPGMLTDHYDPQSKILRLSQEVYFTPSVAAAGIAAHEAGHAVQDAEDYLPMEARTYIVPVVQLASRIAPWLFVAGLMLQMQSLTWAGVILFGSSSLFFPFLTLPVELNASSRAEQLLVSQGIIRGDEQIAGVQSVLGAAAWTYVAAAVSALGSWLFYVVLLVSQTPASADRG